jgi:hypothetical protein|tara:strand:+ start:277 stop:786 length:510 start_codon:yes stop_codon:yes gene_type:complete
MADKINPMFDAPIPGQSMTAELGSRPWQQTPKLTTVEQALDYYIPKLTSPDKIGTLLNLIEQGVPLVLIADSLQTISVMEGIHTLDVGILVIPVMVETMIYLAEEAKIKYTIGTEKVKDGKPDPTSISLAMEKYKKNKNKQSEVKQMVKEKVDEKMPEPPASGLMARRV